jgi:hypothetical protein
MAWSFATRHLCDGQLLKIGVSTSRSSPARLRASRVEAVCCSSRSRAEYKTSAMLPST